MVGKLVGLCLRLLEDAVDDPAKRSWEDVFGALAPVCEELLNMVSKHINNRISQRKVVFPKKDLMYWEGRAKQNVHTLIRPPFGTV